MSEFDQALAGMDLAIMNAFGDTCTKNGSGAFNAVLEENVNRFDDYGQQTVNRYEVTTLNSEGALSTGDQFVFPDGREFTITAIVAGDKSVTTGAAVLE